MTNQVFTIAEKIEIHTARVNEYTREAEAFAKVGDEKRAQNCRRIVENHRAQIAKLQAEADARIAEELADVANDEQGDTMTAEDVELFAAQVSTPNAFVSACKVLAVRARQMFAKAGTFQDCNESDVISYFAELGLNVADGLYTDFAGRWSYTVGKEDPTAEINVPLTTGEYINISKAAPLL